MSRRVRFVVSDRGRIREKIVKREKRSKKTGRRTSVLNRGKSLFLEGHFWVPVGRTS